MITMKTSSPSKSFSCAPLSMSAYFVQTPPNSMPVQHRAMAICQLMLELIILEKTSEPIDYWLGIGRHLGSKRYVAAAAAVVVVVVVGIAVAADAVAASYDGIELDGIVAVIAAEPPIN